MTRVAGNERTAELMIKVFLCNVPAQLAVPQCHTGVLTDTAPCAGVFSGEVWSMKVLLWWRKGAKRGLGLGFGMEFSPLSVFLQLVFILEVQSLNDKKRHSPPKKLH